VSEVKAARARDGRGPAAVRFANRSVLPSTVPISEAFNGGIDDCTDIASQPSLGPLMASHAIKRGIGNE